MDFKNFLYQKLTINYPNLSIIYNKSKDFDFFFPNHKIALNINNLIHKPYDFYYNRFINAKKMNILLLQFWEDELLKKFNFLYNLLLTKLNLLEKIKISSHDCQIVKFNPKTLYYQLIVDFFNISHNKGLGLATNIYALMYMNKIITAITVMDIDNEGYYQLDRYTTDNIHKPMGGFDKLISFAENDLNIQKWYTHVNNDLSWGKLYIDRGWTKIENYKFDMLYFVYNDKRYKRKELKELNISVETLPKIYTAGLSRFDKC